MFFPLKPSLYAQQKALKTELSGKYHTWQWSTEDFGLKCSRICTVRPCLVFPYPHRAELSMQAQGAFVLAAIPARKWGRLWPGSVVEELMEVLHLESRTLLRFWIPCLRKAGSELSAKLFYGCRAPEMQVPDPWQQLCCSPVLAAARGRADRYFSNRGPQRPASLN